MSKNHDRLIEPPENDVEDIYDQEITTSDYGFIFDSEGELKSVFMPTDYFEIPEKVLAVFKMFGIDNPEDVVVHTVH